MNLLETPALDPVRASWYRLVFVLAGLYNLGFGVAAGLFPSAFFVATRQPIPNYPSLFACIGMIVGVYGLLYLLSAWDLSRARPLIAIGLLGKVLGPIGMVGGIATGEWSSRAILLNTFNDVLWWIPFGLFLLEGTRVADRLCAHAPRICAGIHVAAAGLLLVAMQGGTEMVPSIPERMAFVAEHRFAWVLGWSVWMLAALSLMGCLAWWGARLARQGAAQMAFLVAAAGLLVDLFMDSLYIGWYPEAMPEIAPWATVASATVANGLYTVACIGMTRLTPGLSSTSRVLAWTGWAGGLGLAAAGLSGPTGAMAVSTAAMLAGFTGFCWRLESELA